ncbi:hypothetical protein C9374_009338 [Naegleria lovaniensis]|uniref:RGS domain-containing protein n=1 Tax=Naegleria lovaniensis TaxID=51637 RepID=A0AA88KED8_NAELO|nr:uncharacterized protein C9374_009338 [Naegleria lovaniensis]KAG2377427.1 hypothetical protein C9374_009338 [Naegleria lovaniensis]
MFRGAIHKLLVCMLPLLLALLLNTLLTNSSHNQFSADAKLPIISTTIDNFMERVISQQQKQEIATNPSWTTAIITSSNSSIVVLSLRRQLNTTRYQQQETTFSLQALNNHTVHMFSFDLESDDATRHDSFLSSVKMALSMHQIKPLKLVEVSNMLCDCILGNPFVDSNQIEFLITTDKDVPKLIRQIRENSKSRYLELSDFNVVILSPYEIQYVWMNDSSSYQVNHDSFSASLIQNLKDDMISCLYEMKYCRMNVSTSGISSCYEKHDYCWLRRAQNFFQVAHSELFVSFTNQILSKFRKTMALVIEYQPFFENATNTVLEDIFLNSTFSHELFLPTINENITLSQRLDYIMQNEMMNSSQYSCHTSICLFEPLLASEYFQFASILCCLIYYIFLFCMCQKNSMKIRLLLPWCGPLLVMIRILSSGEFIYSTCPVLYSMISIITATMATVIYIITILRVLYLRNLYEIISKRNNIGLYKRLASKKFGIFITLLACLFTFLIMLVFIPMFSRIYLTNSLSISRNVITGSIITLAILSAIIYSTVDFIFHRRDIKKKGLIYFLFFDDPFYIRIDLICLITILILLIPFLTPTRISVLSGLFRMLISLAAYMIMGGNTLFIEWVKMLKYRKSTQFTKFDDTKSTTTSKESTTPSTMINSHQHTNSLEYLLKDSNFFEMLKTYSEKEFSLENILLFEQVQELVRTQKLTLSQLSQIEENFLKPYSKYEVNISSTTKKAFHEWHERMKNSQVRDSHEFLLDAKEIETLFNILYDDILNNLNDTFSRLQATEEFMKWEKVVDLQRQQSVER